MNLNLAAQRATIVNLVAKPNNHVAIVVDVKANLNEVEDLGLVPVAVFALATDNSKQEPKEPRRAKVTLHRKLAPANWAFKGFKGGKIDSDGPTMLLSRKGWPVLTVDDQEVTLRLRLEGPADDQAWVALRALLGADAVASTVQVQLPIPETVKGKRASKVPEPNAPTTEARQ